MSKVFPIIKDHPTIANSFIITGHGFFIDRNGTFITAGHVLRNPANYYICLPDGNNMDLIPVTSKRYYYRENYFKRNGGFDNGLLRNRRYYQCGPEHKDVAIGRVDLTNTEFLKFTKKRPSLSDNLTVNYFRPNRVYASTGVGLTNNQIPDFYIQADSVTLQKGTNDLLSLVPYNHTNPIIFNDPNNYYNNCIWTNGTTGHGVSGCPVINNQGLVVGMVIGGVERQPFTLVLLSRYILKTSKKLYKILR